MNNDNELTEQAQGVSDLLWDIDSLIQHAISDLMSGPYPADEIALHMLEASKEVKHARNLFERSV